MFRSLGITAGIVIVASSNTTVSAIGISPQDDNVRIVGSSSGRVFATTVGAPLLAEGTPPVSTRRFIGGAVIDPKDAKTAYVTLVGFMVSDSSFFWLACRQGRSARSCHRCLAAKEVNANE